MTRTAFLVLVATLALAAHASAQPSPARVPGGTGADARVELAAGVGWLGAVALDGQDATLHGNSPGGEAFRLFSAETRLAGAPSIDGRIGVALTRRYSIEGRVAYARPELGTSLSADFEQAPPLTAVESVSEYLIEGGIAIRFPGVEFAGMSPFVAAGAGYRRQLHEGKALVEEGTAYYAGGGVRHTFLTRPRGALRTVGWRVDARLYLVSGGLTSGDQLHARAAASGSLFVGF